MRLCRLKAHLLPIRQANSLAVASDVASSLLDQNLMLIALGIVVHHGRAVRRQGRRRTRHNHLRPRTLNIRSRRQIHRARAHRNRNVGLLLIVGRVLLDHNQRILFHRVVRAIIKYDLGHAFRAGLHHIAFFQRNAVVCRSPTVAVRLLHPNRAVERGEVCLLRTRAARLRRIARGPGHDFQQLGAKPVRCLDAVLGELRKCKAHANENNQQDRQHQQRHAAVRDRLPRDVDSRLAV